MPAGFRRPTPGAPRLGRTPRESTRRNAGASVPARARSMRLWRTWSRRQVRPTLRCFRLMVPRMARPGRIVMGPDRPMRTVT
eukprot:6516838-Alexandrium_andersonii.AAC.1